MLKKYFDVIKKEVGATKVSSGVLEGNYKGKITFEDKTIEIGFSKINR